MLAVPDLKFAKVNPLACHMPIILGELGEEVPNLMQPLADVLLSKPYVIGWSYHAYSPILSQDLGEEIWYSLRYRQIA